MEPISALIQAALGDDQARLERVASNLANTQTVAYKRELWVTRSAAPPDFAQMMDAAEVASTGESARDLRPGTLKPTGRALDVALDGPGFFEVATEQGPAYTRRGDWRVDAQGRLVTGQGLPVLGQGGEINLSSAQVVIDARGQVLDGGRQVATLRVVDLPPQALRPVGQGLYVSNMPPQEGGRLGQVRQGQLEGANVDVAAEMLALTATTRHFEAVLRITQGRDEMLGTAIRRLGEQ